MIDPVAYVLWITVPQHLQAPHFLLSAGTMAEVASWRKRNTWADATPLSLFGDPADLGVLGRTFLGDPLPGVPSRAENVPAAAFEGWSASVQYDLFRSRLAMFNDQLEHYAAFVTRVVSLMPPGRIWVPCADSDGGVCALAAARGRQGPVVALASSPPGILAATMSRDIGVPISYRARSGDGLVQE
jgi:hypothetical protein